MTTRVKRGAVSAGAAVVATGAAVAVLQLLQETVGAFRPPRPRPAAADPAVADALRRLASWLGAVLDVSGEVLGRWAGAFR